MKFEQSISESVRKGVNPETSITPETDEKSAESFGEKAMHMFRKGGMYLSLSAMLMACNSNWDKIDQLTKSKLEQDPKTEKVSEKEIQQIQGIIDLAKTKTDVTSFFKGKILEMVEKDSGLERTSEEDFENVKYLIELAKLKHKEILYVDGINNDNEYDLSNLKLVLVDTIANSITFNTNSVGKDTLPPSGLGEFKEGNRLKPNKDELVKEYIKENSKVRTKSENKESYTYGIDEKTNSLYFNSVIDLTQHHVTHTHGYSNEPHYDGNYRDYYKTSLVADLKTGVIYDGNYYNKYGTGKFGEDFSHDWDFEIAEGGSVDDQETAKLVYDEHFKRGLEELKKLNLIK